ncbi:hypothetical protein KFU94_47705 [Chloroflexi bacterium TSY]|nr:hypothetical protein [Chloroflexi bacterium TSY]
MYLILTLLFFSGLTFMSLYAAYVIAGLADDAIERKVETTDLLYKLRRITSVKKSRLTPQPVQTERRNNHKRV